MSRVRAELEAQIDDMVRRHQAAEEDVRAECERLSQALAEKEMILQSVEERLVSGAEGEEKEAAIEIDAELDVESVLAIDRSLGEEEAAVGAEARSGHSDDP